MISQNATGHDGMEMQNEQKKRNTKKKAVICVYVYMGVFVCMCN